jgi:hypothetical protein
MNEDNKKDKYRKIKYFFIIIFIYITDILYIKLLIIEKSSIEYVYIDLISLFLFSSSLLHIIYQDFFLKHEVKNKSKALLLLPMVALMLPASVRYIPYDLFSMFTFVIVVINILIILLIWTILVWFEKRRNKKTTIKHIN